MKFSHTLSLNANPDWERHYIDYAGLKKVINETETQAHVEGDLENPPKKFLEKLTKMIKHVREFYDMKLAELEDEMTRLQPDLEKSASEQNLASMLPETDEETAPLLKASLRPSVFEDKRAEICDMFTRYHNLEMFGELNCK